MIKKIKFFTVTIMAVLVMLSCSKDDEVSPPNPLNGDYSGTCEFVNISDYTMWYPTFTATVEGSKISIDIDNFISITGSVGTLGDGWFNLSETIDNVKYTCMGTVYESGIFRASIISDPTTGSLSGNKD
jgi:hypothetical protein